MSSKPLLNVPSSMHSPWRVRWASIVLVIASIWLWLHCHLQATYSEPLTTVDIEANPSQFLWGSITPTSKLIWVDCFPGFQCARLEVPLNYSNPSGTSAAIALIRLPSPLSEDNEDYRGPVLFNPGGPGGSGVDTVHRSGLLFSQLLGPQFDIVGFDPRGVGHSTPGVSFFNSSLERILWYAQRGGSLRELNNTPDALGEAWSAANVLNSLARDRMQAETLSSINTDHTARDMLSIVEAHGREKLQYWGFSYGTILGATFATLFPDKVERIVIDGVVDAEDYYRTEWYNNLLDTDKTFKGFLDSCVSAGPVNCAFYAPTAELIQQNITKLYEAVKAQPIPVYTPTFYGVANYNLLRIAIFSSFYTPYATWPLLAEALADLAQGDGARLFQLLLPSPSPENNDDTDEFVAGPEVQNAIACNDGSAIPNSLGELKEDFEKLSELSEWGSLWIGIRTACSAWPKRLNDHFQGPVEGNTSFPLLLVGNSADPVTPLWAAHKTSHKFPGSIVLSQASAGHCSISAPSPCTQTYIREYFINGTLPQPGTWCLPVGSPFPHFSGEDEAQAAFTDTEDVDMDLLRAVQDLASRQVVQLPNPF